MFCVYVLPVGVYHGVHPVKALILEEFDRSAPDGTGSAKVGGNYAPVLRWSEKARNEGYGITLHLDSKTRSEIDEFSTSGFIGVKKEGDSVTLVVPDSKCVIKSVTSDSCLRIAESKGWKVEERSVSPLPLPLPLPPFVSISKYQTNLHRSNTKNSPPSPKSSPPAQPPPSSPSNPSPAPPATKPRNTSRKTRRNQVPSVLRFYPHLRVFSRVRWRILLVGIQVLRRLM